MKKTLLSVIALAAFVAMPLVHAVERGSYRMVTGTFDRTVEENTVTFRSDSVNVNWSPADDTLGSAGRTEGYWFGLEVTSPSSFTKEEYEKIKYSFDGKTWKSFKANQDKYVEGHEETKDQGINTLWVKTTEEEYEAASKTDARIITKYVYLDWNGDNQTDETVKIILETDKVQLNHAGANAYVTLTVVNNVNDSKVVIRLKSGAKLTPSQLESIKKEPKTGFTFKYAYQTVDEEQEEIDNLKDFTISENTTISAYFEKTGSTATTPSGNQGSSTTKPADKDSTPKTGNTDLMGFVPLMTLLSLVGIVTLKKTI